MDPYEAYIQGDDSALAQWLESADPLQATSLRGRELQAVRALVERDPLTGAYNRHGIQRLWSESNYTWVGIIDLDNFKSLNDKQGHARGDEALRRVALELHGLGLGPVGRWGGDEFVVLVKSGAQPARFSLSLPYSAGWTHCHDEGDLALLIERADRELYKEKDA
jgi:PleD family two-component response regulator